MKIVFAMCAALGFAAPVMAAEPPMTELNQQAPGYYRMMLGKLRITAVSDGTVTVPLDKLLTHISPQELQRRMAAAAGYPANTIDAVLLTHIHADHSGGVSRAGKLAFPNAMVYVDKRDADFWLNPNNANKVEASQRHTFAESAQTIGPVAAANRLKTFTAPATLLNSIHAMAGAGHTPGSVIYRVESEGQTLMLWGDIIHAKAVQLPEPQVAIHFDVNQQQAINTRKRVLAKAADQGAWVAAAHIAFPGLGHVMRDGQGYRWVAANYTTQLAP